MPLWKISNPLLIWIVLSLLGQEFSVLSRQGQFGKHYIAVMFWSNYPASVLTHRRRLHVRGAPTGAAILPKGEPEEPDEAKYDNCTGVLSAMPGQMFVIEWTGQDVEQHHVDL